MRARIVTEGAVGRNTKRNRERDAILRGKLDRIEKHLSTRNFDAAQNLLYRFKLAVGSFHSLYFDNRYNDLVDKLRNESARPCDCWYCGFTPEEKKQLAEDAEKKTASLDQDPSYNHVNNFTGAYAEAVFGVKFHRPINLRPGPDGGIDFVVPCEQVPSGTLTVDIKGTGTIHDRLLLPAAVETVEGPVGITCVKGFICEPNHIYVLIQVVGGQHAFFRGFAFGSDQFRPTYMRLGKDLPTRFYYYPASPRTEQELLALLRAERKPSNI